MVRYLSLKSVTLPSSSVYSPQRVKSVGALLREAMLSALRRANLTLDALDGLCLLEQS